jgi:5'-3' exonuclease
MLSLSDTPGEGEHKIFRFLREECERSLLFRTTYTTLIYGLDADLFMLSLNHLRYQENLFLYRETPEYIKSLQDILSPSEEYFIDVQALMLAIQGEMTMRTQIGCVNDYVFMCFFLGNDFLPHFPALNLRTRGLDTLLQTYTATIAKDKKLYDGDVIYWENVNVFVKALGCKEAREVAREYLDRNKRTVENTPENAPLVRREVEHYINPTEPGWESRYYAALLKMDPTPGALEKVCNDYFTMLTWNTLYYSNGCPDWNVSYPHMYPPLLKHLESHVPTETKSFEQGCPKTCQELLTFVLPPSARCHVPNMSADSTCATVPEQYWAFCTFAWESHLLF